MIFGSRWSLIGSPDSVDFIDRSSHMLLGYAAGAEEPILKTVIFSSFLEQTNLFPVLNVSLMSRSVAEDAPGG